MTLSVCARRENVILDDAAVRGIEKGLADFDELVRWLPCAKRWIPQISDEEIVRMPEVLRRMTLSVRRLGDPAFTPMAAVAGAFADIIREEICAVSPADYVIVNNGGDISFNADGELRVGIVSDIGRREITHRLVLPTGGIHGIATSGFGGRSLSRGIASAVTVIAETCALADACATDIANHTCADAAEIIFCPANEIDYDSDLQDLSVVREVGKLDERTVHAALENGFARAKQLCEAGTAKGAVLFVKNSFTFYPNDLMIAEIPKQAME